jgi:hypothetical protein
MAEHRAPLSARPATAPLLAALLVGCVLAACGGATPSTGAATTAATPSATAVPPSPSLAASLAPSLEPSDVPSDPPSAAPLDPCSLITRAEANAVTGVKTLAPEAAGDPPTRCVWATPTSGAVGQVEIDVGDGAKKAYDIDATVLKHTFTPIAGLGDEGYSEDGAVFFRAGTTWAAIHVTRLDDPKTWMPKLVALAKVVAGRL